MENKIKKAHFIGICGVGMSAVAKLLKDSGWEISGSDSGFYPPVSIYLEKQKLSCEVGYRAENIPEDTEMIVIGKNAKLTPEENEEVKSAYESDIEVKSFPEVLNLLTKNTRNIICAGSHGKSTCSSIMTWCLHNAGKDPSFFIGALPLNFDVTSHLGEGETFVLEGDEYPSSNTDSSSKFMHYNAHDVLITSVEHDHVNVFKTQEDFSKPFIELINSLPKDGLLVINTGDREANKLSENFDRDHATYSVDADSVWRAENINYGQITTFDLIKNNKKVTGLETRLLGRHNIENIVGVAAMLLEKKLLTTEELQDGIKTFKGIVRRLDLKTEKSTVPCYEGFGSSYTKAKAAIDAIKLHFPTKRLVIVFEPHTFSWRNKDYIHHYDTIFEGVEKVFVYKPATQGSGTHAQLTHSDIVDRVKSSGVDVEHMENEKEGLEKIKKEVTENDVVLLLTSGNLDGMVQSIPHYLETNFL